jgi:uncharacterized membrane protein YidH (DUF202 family)
MKKIEFFASTKITTLPIVSFFVTALFASPALAFAAGNGIPDLISQFNTILNYIVPFLIGLAVFIIIYGIFGYISQAADEEKRKEAKDFIMWGVIGVVVMLSVWGLVSVLVNTFNLDSSTKIVTDRYGVARDAYGNIIPDTNNALQTPPSTVIELITRVNIIGSYVIPFLIAIAVFIIILGMVNYVRQADNEEKRAEGRMFIIWGVISILNYLVFAFLFI